MRLMIRHIVDELLQSDEQSIRWNVRASVFGEDPRGSSMKDLRDEVRRSPRVQALLARRVADGRLVAGRGVYAKWQYRCALRPARERPDQRLGSASSQRLRSGA